MYRTENKQDTGRVLSTLAGIIQEFNVPVDQYLRQIGEHEMFNPFQSNAPTDCTKMAEPTCDKFWERLGIRRLTLDRFQSKQVIPDHFYGGNDDGNKNFGRWNRIKNEALVKELSDIFSSCPIIEFADWAEVDDASEFWDGLYSDVIKPLKKRDYQFIFHLGDVSKKKVFETDEVLDIIGNYSSYGKVTLMLGDLEADNLWSRLNGRSPEVFISGFDSPEARERYLFLFNTMKIDVLLVLHGCYALLFSRDGQLDLAGRPPAGIQESIDTRDRFSAGYQIGLLLQLDIPHCVALGAAVSEGYTKPSSGSGSTCILEHIQEWTPHS
jgi:hypothetical protein